MPKLTANKTKAKEEASVSRLPSRPEMDADRGRAFLVQLVAHRVAEANQRGRDHRLQTNDKHPCDPASSPCRRPHSA